jgi:hypothetical protein
MEPKDIMEFIKSRFVGSLACQIPGKIVPLPN